MTREELLVIARQCNAACGFTSKDFPQRLRILRTHTDEQVEGLLHAHITSVLGGTVEGIEPEAFLNAVADQELTQYLTSNFKDAIAPFLSDEGEEEEEDTVAEEADEDGDAEEEAEPAGDTGDAEAGATADDNAEVEGAEGADGEDEDPRQTHLDLDASWENPGTPEPAPKSSVVPDATPQEVPGINADGSKPTGAPDDTIQVITIPSGASSVTIRVLSAPPAVLADVSDEIREKFYNPDTMLLGASVANWMAICNADEMLTVLNMLKGPLANRTALVSLLRLAGIQQGKPLGRVSDDTLRGWIMEWKRKGKNTGRAEVVRTEVPAAPPQKPEPPAPKAAAKRGRPRGSKNRPKVQDEET